MDVFLTVVTGFITYALGQIAVKLLIDPVQEFKRVVADISHALIEYANVYGNPGITGVENEKKVSGELRKLSSRLNAQRYLIPAYRVSAKLFGLPSLEKATKAAEHLIGLSNGFGSNNRNQGILNSYRAQHVCNALGIYVSERERLDPALENEFLNG